MRPKVTINRCNKKSKLRTDKLELFFYTRGVMFHRHSLVEDTPSNRELFPVHRKFKDRLYTTQEIMVCVDEIEEILRLFTLKDADVLVSKYFRSNWFTRILWRLILKVISVWQKRQLK